MNRFLLRSLYVCAGLVAAEFIVLLLVNTGRRGEILAQHRKAVQEIQSTAAQTATELRRSHEEKMERLRRKHVQNQYLARGKNVFHRIYNRPEENILSLLQSLATEAFPSDWETEVKVEEFTRFILMVQAPTRDASVEPKSVAQYLAPMLPYTMGALSDVAVFNHKHQCQLYYDPQTLRTLRKEKRLNHEDTIRVRRQAEQCTKFNAVEVPCKDVEGHILVPVSIDGDTTRVSCYMLLDTGASKSMISREVWQKTGGGNYGQMPQQLFSTAGGSASHRMAERHFNVEGVTATLSVAVNFNDEMNLLGVDFFEGKRYVIDAEGPSLYIWQK